MTRALLVVTAVVVGLGIGFAIDYQIFKNPPQQIALVRNGAIIAVILEVVYFGRTRRPLP